MKSCDGAIRKEIYEANPISELYAFRSPELNL